MIKPRIVGSIVVAALAAACSVEVQIPGDSAGSTTGTTGAGGTTTATSTSSTTSGGAGGSGAGGSAGLGGHYLRQDIGNCINGETWLSFGPAGKLTHTLIDRNFCGPHSVIATPGTYAVDGPVLQLDWSTEEGAEQRRFTFLLLDPYLAEPVGLPPEYQPSTAALHTRSYAQQGGYLLWHREDRALSKAPGMIWDQATTVDLTLDIPLEVPPEPVACTMTVEIAVAVQFEVMSPPSLGKETFVFPCTLAKDPMLPWMRVQANGFDPPAGGQWNEFLNKQGIWQKYPGLVGSAILASFEPVVYFVPGDGSRLFHGTWWSAYQEMKNPPPESVP